MKPLVPGENQNRNENESGRQESRPDGKPLHGTTNYVTYEDDQPEGHLPVLALLDTLRCQCFDRESILGKTPQIRRALLELEALWQSLGCPRLELWLRLSFYDNDTVYSSERTPESSPVPVGYNSNSFGDLAAGKRTAQGRHPNECQVAQVA